MARINLSSLERMVEVYHITEAEYNLYCVARTNLDTQIGYQAYYQLDKAITGRKGDESLLCDLAADFAWDNRLSDAFEALKAQEQGA